MRKDKVCIKGKLIIVVKNKSGSIKEKRVIYNKITNTGLAALAALVLTDITDSDEFDYVGVGTGTTAATASDTTLGSEITDAGLSRAAGTGTRVTTAVTNDTAQLVKEFNVTGTKAVTEAGIFNASSGGTMLSHQVFTAINVQDEETLEITWQLQFKED